MRNKATGSAAKDGRYSYTGTIKEVGTDVQNKNAFKRDAILQAIGEIFDLTALTVDEELGTFTVELKDKRHMHWKWTDKRGVELI